MIYDVWKNRIGVGFVLFALTLFTACQTDEQIFQKDLVSKNLLEKQSKLISSGQKPSNEEFEQIKLIFEKYPASATARQSYQLAILSREDWGALENLLAGIPENLKTAEDKTNLGKTLFKLGKYRHAIALLEPFESESGIEVKGVIASSHFHLGNIEQARSLLDSNWEWILREKRVDEISIRGMIFLYDKDYDRAIETLGTAMEMEPNYIPAANGLSKVYAAKGETEKANEYLLKIQRTFDKYTAEERRKTRFVANIYKLRDAYKANRFHEVIELANEILPEADPANKAVIYQYMFNSYQAMGRATEARIILQQSNQLLQK